ncbi:hypothetical protein [Actinopolymorpha rutila]|uniref:Uncharacterized protein n=1 Tax=Actinopolymorpha rutila TaxID=446787 RepID=A0A852ZML8_9ACTN|nr:hypothetical protein [Actinopolymorpha rutila]NYH93128.1 hypothetical protein [Actinopolymorpha rutila]
MLDEDTARSEGDWLARQVGERAAFVLTTYAVPCLHFAHAEAARLFDATDYLNATAYGQLRYHILCEVLGRVIEQRLPAADVHRPSDRIGTAFTVEFGGRVVYPYKYSEGGADPYAGFRLADDDALKGRLAPGDVPRQGILAGMPELPPGELLVLAWAGNHHEGLARAVLGVPVLNAGRLRWAHGRVVELDLRIGQDHTGRDDQGRPTLDLDRIDADLDVDFDAMFPRFGRS